MAEVHVPMDVWNKDAPTSALLPPTLLFHEVVYIYGYLILLITHPYISAAVVVSFTTCGRPCSIIYGCCGSTSD